MQYATAAVEALSNIFSARTVKSFLNGPPAHFDPTVHTMRGWQKKFSQVWLKEGFGAAYNNLRMSTVHRGRHPGRHRSPGQPLLREQGRPLRPHAVVRDADPVRRVGH